MDSYERFLNRFDIQKDDLYAFGLEETVFPEYDVVRQNWDSLKSRIYNNKPVYIRGYGRDAHGTELYTNFYKLLLGNTCVIKDPTNNMKPQALISQLTGLKRNKNIFNYQVSHIFGKTKNVFLFENPWNIVFVPKIIDPFTGHETSGCWPEEYQALFVESSKQRYKDFIHDYNEIIRTLDVPTKLSKYIQDLISSSSLPMKTIEQFRMDALSELSPIL